MKFCENFDPEKDIPSLSGKIILITGGTAGVGKATILALAKHGPDHIYFTGRNARSAEEVVNEVATASPRVKTTFVQCDLSSLASVNEAAKQLRLQRLDVLIANAGIKAETPALSKNGYEVHFATHHLGHALFIKHLLPIMLQTAQQPGADVRIVLVTSLGYRLHPNEGIVFNDLKTPQEGLGFNGWRAYGQSKLANVLYAVEVSRRYPEITSVSVHPGVVGTDMVANLSFVQRAIIYVTNLGRILTPEEGAYNQLWAATHKKEDIVNGEFYEPVGKPGRRDKLSKDQNVAKKLWEWTEAQLAAV
ncbi:oxidoreductase [Gloeophyllum trabeum ATCC 11539]|uniref:Oxidoreductase n=1 Tax=Gloeophyllum trabeum (strain ATCC 11539 / FP-39264 / Madison 617) TaxID=670483 RepID=S7Q8J6_GLOTA|nr:oxidoreductase [Gloeophyllum trabeum ATCC 11539]EPQ56306.1 oxidoreductase [Gloeophyllum trabeum ATCC 11539]